MCYSEMPSKFPWLKIKGMKTDSKNPDIMRQSLRGLMFVVFMSLNLIPSLSLVIVTFVLLLDLLQVSPHFSGRSLCPRPSCS